MTLSVRFDPTGPYDVDTVDSAFARPAGVELLARLYRPKGEPVRPLGGLVYVHGGAWARLDRTADSVLCQALAASGLVVIALDFRQAPDHRYPAASADVAAGVRYARPTPRGWEWTRRASGCSAARAADSSPSSTR